MEDLKTQLEEAQNRLKMNDSCLEFATESHKEKRSELLAEISGIEKQIADSEVTYSIGDRFKNTNSGEKWIIVMTGRNIVGMSSLADGHNYGLNYITVADNHKITKRELSDIIQGNGYCFTRIWDNRKQEKC